MNKRQEWLIATIIISLLAGLISFYIYLQVVPKPKVATIDLSLLPDKPKIIVPKGYVLDEKPKDLFQEFGVDPKAETKPTPTNKLGLIDDAGIFSDKPKITYLNPKVIQDYYFEGLLLSGRIMGGVWALWLFYLIPLAIIGLTRGFTSRVEKANKETFWKMVMIYILLLLTIFIIWLISHRPPPTYSPSSIDRFLEKYR